MELSPRVSPYLPPAEEEENATLLCAESSEVRYARWDKMVRDYGTAILAMAGNIVTAWSWFGVNELSAGLHNYGFTEGRMGMLVTFIGVQLAVIAAATLIRPRNPSAV